MYQIHKETIRGGYEMSPNSLSLYPSRLHALMLRQTAWTPLN